MQVIQLVILFVSILCARSLVSMAFRESRFVKAVSNLTHHDACQLSQRSFDTSITRSPLLPVTRKLPKQPDIFLRRCWVLFAVLIVLTTGTFRVVRHCLHGVTTWRHSRSRGTSSPSSFALFIAAPPGDQLAVIAKKNTTLFVALPRTTSNATIVLQLPSIDDFGWLDYVGNSFHRDWEQVILQSQLTLVEEASSVSSRSTALVALPVDPPVHWAIDWLFWMFFGVMLHRLIQIAVLIVWITTRGLCWLPTAVARCGYITYDSGRRCCAAIRRRSHATPALAPATAPATAQAEGATARTWQRWRWSRWRVCSVSCWGRHQHSCRLDECRWSRWRCSRWRFRVQVHCRLERRSWSWWWWQTCWRWARWLWSRWRWMLRWHCWHSCWCCCWHWCCRRLHVAGCGEGVALKYHEGCRDILDSRFLRGRKVGGHVWLTCSFGCLVCRRV